LKQYFIFAKPFNPITASILDVMHATADLQVLCARVERREGVESWWWWDRIEELLA
jgi:hypothetical protein